MVFSAQFFVTRNLKTHGFIMIDNGNSRPKFDTNLNLSYGIKCRFFLLIWSLYHLNFGHFLVKVTIGQVIMKHLNNSNYSPNSKQQS